MHRMSWRAVSWGGRYPRAAARSSPLSVFLKVLSLIDADSPPTELAEGEGEHVVRAGWTARSTEGQHGPDAFETEHGLVSWEAGLLPCRSYSAGYTSTGRPSVLASRSAMRSAPRVPPETRSIGFGFRAAASPCFLAIFFPRQESSLRRTWPWQMSGSCSPTPPGGAHQHPSVRPSSSPSCLRNGCPSPRSIHPLYSSIASPRRMGRPFSGCSSPILRAQH